MEELGVIRLLSHHEAWEEDVPIVVNKLAVVLKQIS